MRKIMFAIIALFTFSVNAMCQQLQPTDSDALVKVAVVSFENKPMPGEKVSLQSLKTQKMYSGITNASGKFQLLLPKNCDYKIFYKEFTANADYKQNLSIPPAENQMLTFNFTIRVELPKTFTLKNVFFDSGNATLKKESDKELDELVDFMKHQPTMIIEVAGYTDNVGTDDANMKLSQQRAESVRNYLVSKGVSADKVQAKGYGSSTPIASNDTPEGKQQNRRTEIHIIKN
jgi:OOP family OmpA-OmpF porin